MYFKEKSILIIGATGTIGESLLNEILVQQPKMVRLFSRDEYKQIKLRERLGNIENIQFFIGDVRDNDRLLNAMVDIDYVFHLAAMKHVSTCEYNPYEAVLTNINGTYNVIKSSLEKNVKKVIYISTDKAIFPSNTYGATKLTAERLITSAEYSKGNRSTTFAIVRLGNVISSRGSVVPLFVRQILNDRRITVTNLMMTRFMITLQQATTLTMKALKESKGGETFVLKMPVVRLKDLVTVVIEQTCEKYNINAEDIKMETIGIRPGEKMYEELMTPEELEVAMELSDMFVIPAFFKQTKGYEHSFRAEYGSYSSKTQKPLTLMQIRELLKNSFV
ncbi:polysaccharide biosynthesis protein [Metabacillus herbersteinensis]|uniref:Polysaccharide biosynthesis protein n=1 Tax=Metabacillus herbersteinensis TaxID=283816 RepID=A0ABV6GE16_9BACI